LLPLDDYLSLFPNQAMLPEQELMPLRIEYERRERERMDQQRLELVKVKEGLGKENAQKKEVLRKMDEKLEAMIESLKPIEDALAKDV
jgi:Fms-interacting protein/Thoc5